MIILRKLNGKLMLIRGSTGGKLGFSTEILLTAIHRQGAAGPVLVTTALAIADLPCVESHGSMPRMSDSQVDFNAPAERRKWPSQGTR
jgi:hypothetical protein